jgi:hypothetical protein
MRSVFDYHDWVGENKFAPVTAFLSGPVAQLGARFHGMEEVVGSIPTRSTNPELFFRLSELLAPQ